jgi:hypothetical protein
MIPRPKAPARLPLDTASFALSASADGFHQFEPVDM